MTGTEPSEIPSRTLVSQEYACNTLTYDTFGDHLQTCQTKSTDSQVHDWVVHKLGSLLGSVGHRVKIYNITPATGNNLGEEM